MYGSSLGTVHRITDGKVIKVYATKGGHRNVDVVIV